MSDSLHEFFSTTLDMHLAINNDAYHYLRLKWLKGQTDKGNLVSIKPFPSIHIKTPLVEKEIFFSTSERGNIDTPPPQARPTKQFTREQGGTDWLRVNWKLVQDILNQYGISQDNLTHAQLDGDGDLLTTQADDIMIHLSYSGNVNRLHVYSFIGVPREEFPEFEHPDLVLSDTEEYSFSPFYQDKENNLDVHSVHIDKRTGDTRSTQLKLYHDLFSGLECNYNKDSFNSVSNVIKQLQGDSFLGKLLFFHGEPGTGKTHLLKSMLGELKDKYISYIISTPVDFFHNNGYNQLVEGQDPKTRLALIFEDADSLVSEDARDRYPDAFSMLANSTSGLIGSGRNDIFIFTFNRDVRKIDSALLRECRCLGDIYVGPMDKDTIKAFQDKHGFLGLEPNATLAQAYERLLDAKKSTCPKTEKRSIGF